MMHIRKQGECKMRLKSYLKEASYGKRVGIERVAQVRPFKSDKSVKAMIAMEDPTSWRPYIQWILHPDTDNDEVNMKTLQDVAWKEAMSLKRKGFIDFEDWIDWSIGPVSGPGHNTTWEASVHVKADSYEPDKLIKALKKLKFRIEKR